MRFLHVLFACLVCSMHSSSFLEAIDWNGVKTELEKIKNYGSALGDLGTDISDVNNALNAITSAINTTNSTLNQLTKYTLDMSRQAVSFGNENKSPTLKLNNQTIQNAEKAVKNVEAIAHDISDIIIELGTMMHAFVIAAPSIGTAAVSVGNTMKKLKVSAGDTAVTVGNSLPTKMTDFYTTFVDYQHKVTSSIQSVCDKVDHIMHEAKKPLKQLMHLQKNLKSPTSIVAKGA